MNRTGTHPAGVLAGAGHVGPPDGPVKGGTGPKSAAAPQQIPIPHQKVSGPSRAGSGGAAERADAIPRVPSLPGVSGFYTRSKADLSSL